MDKSEITISIEKVKDLPNHGIGCYDEEDQEGLVLIIEEDGGGMLDSGIPYNWIQECENAGVELHEPCEGILFPEDKTKTAQEIEIVLTRLGFTVENKCEPTEKITKPEPVKSNNTITTEQPNTKGKGFYFQLVRQVSGAFFLITPKEVYDKEGCLSDESGIADNVVPEGFYELAESTYEFDGTPEGGRQLLINAGFTEIDFGFNNPVEPSNSGDDEFEEERREYDEENDLDTLLNDVNAPLKEDDYQNTSTDKLLRHIKIMIMSESFEKAEEIKKELHSRGVTEF